MQVWKSFELVFELLIKIGDFVHDLIHAPVPYFSPRHGCFGANASMDTEKYSLPAIGGHCTSAAVLIGCHAQRNGPIESNGEILKYHSCGFIIDVSLFSTIKIDVLIHFKIISQIR